jgi:hypothetical protein
MEWVMTSFALLTYGEQMLIPGEQSKGAKH